MSNEEKILEMLSAMQGNISAMQGDISMIQGDMREVKGRLDSLEGNVDKLQDDLTQLKEDHQITREGVNKVVEWGDNAGLLLKIPFGKSGA